MNQIRVGDVVRLKSGGPAMTVTAIEDSGKVECSYFASSNEMFSFDFPAECLDRLPTG